MGKRSDFKKIDKDAYMTIDKRAVVPLVRYFGKTSPIIYAEPCCGDGSLINHLKDTGIFLCRQQSDISTGTDVFDVRPEDISHVDYIITNPPWSRNVLVPMIHHFMTLGKPTWLLFDSDWIHTLGATEPLEKYCTDILSIGRLKWIPDTKMQSKDNCSWYLFRPDKEPHDTVKFYPKNFSSWVEKE